MAFRHANAGFEVGKHRARLIAVLKDIAADHVARCGDCELPEGFEEAVLCDIAASVERQERPRTKTAA